MSDEDVFTEYKKIKQDVLNLIERDYGKRCEVKDTEDFPEMLGKTEPSEGRCILCLVYERFDKFCEIFGPDEDTDDI